ncbi:MAG: glycosyl hydrolase family 28-related protein [Kiritimatiellaeota bacterium]|nr:glycosyl hydrolase family 28-related protein [Kiritimatiellota bacterium]
MEKIITCTCAGLLSLVTVAAQPVVFWSPDQCAPGEVTLLYGGGLAGASAVLVKTVDGKAAEISAPALQPCENSVKFVLPATLPPGVFSVQVVAGGERSAPRLLNLPELWFMQPTRLLPGLNENQAAPGATVQLVGKNLALPNVQGAPRIALRRDGKAIELPAERSEKFSLLAKLPESLATGRYELFAHNGSGGDAGWGGPLPVEIRAPDVWPSQIFDVKKFGAKGDDVTDDTEAIRAALAAADKNGGGIVQFPWGTYRLTNWICIPPRTVVRGESRDSTLLKWPVDEPTSATNFMTAAIFGAPPYALEDLTVIVRKADTALMDLSWEHFYNRSVPPELLPKLQPFGAFRDVFLRRVFFQNWLWCGHPERQPDMRKKYFGEPYDVRVGGVRNFEISDCVLWGANNYFANNRNVRITGNAVANGMGGHSWTCLGGGAHFTVCESNDLNCSSSWGWGWTGIQKVYSAHNVSHNFVRGEREAMTLDISALPTARPASQHWGPCAEAGTRDGKAFLRFEGVRWTPDCFAGGAALLRAGNQTRNITGNSADMVFLDQAFKPAPTNTAIIEIAPRHFKAHGGTTAWLGRLSESQATEFTAKEAKWIPQEFIGMTALVLDGKGAGQYRVITANTPDHATLERAWDVTPDASSVIGIWSLMRHMIVSDSEGFDTSSFAQLYGAFFDYTVDGCHVERTQGIWGQMGWFVQLRNNTIRYANSYHPGIGMRGPNPEKCAPFGYTGLDSHRLRITKSQAFQYPGRKLPLFADEVLGAPPPSTLACILRGNRLDYGQRLVMQPWSSDNAPGPRPGGALFRDVIIEGNSIAHSTVGIQIGPNVGGVILGHNNFKDVAQPVVEAVAHSAKRIEP